MYHFYIVNTQQQPVERALQQQITSRFTDMQGIENLPYLLHWFKTQVARGTDAQALRLAEFLNDNPDSPLRDRIHMANDPASSRGRIRQAGLVTMFKEHIFSGTNPVFIREPEPDRRNQIMLHYFRAIDGVFVEPGQQSATVVYKSNGLYFFLVISKWVFTSMYASGLNFTEDAIAQVMQKAVDEMEYPYYEIGDSDWWLPGPRGASSLNRASARAYAEEFLHALTRSEA